MNLNYQVNEPPKELKNLKSSYDAHNKLMANMQLCGAFSDKLIDRVFALSWNALDVRIEQEKGKVEYNIANKALHKLYLEFQGLFDAYNIFSDEFKVYHFGLFHTLCFYVAVKKKQNNQNNLIK
jgi:hypothetical protein